MRRKAFLKNEQGVRESRGESCRKGMLFAVCGEKRVDVFVWVVGSRLQSVMWMMGVQDGQ